MDELQQYMRMEGSLEQQVLQLFSLKDIDIDSSTISACHALPRMDSKAKPATLIWFLNRKVKSNLPRQAKKTERNGYIQYLNEHLNRKNSDISRQARLSGNKAKYKQHGRGIVKRGLN